MPENYFDIKRDIEIERKGGFFCQACIVGKPAKEISPDPRYCLGCYELLVKEAEKDTSRRVAEWKPIYSTPKPQLKENLPQAEGIKATKKVAQGLGDMRTNMSTLKHQKAKVDIIDPSPTVRPVIKRGAKAKVLPIELIAQWASENMGAKAIATKLKREQGIVVSYKTIQRVLSGERN